MSKRTNCFFPFIIQVLMVARYMYAKQKISFKMLEYFRLQVEYVRTGLTRLFSATQYSVRPLRHDQVIALFGHINFKLWRGVYW